MLSRTVVINPKFQAPDYKQITITKITVTQTVSFCHMVWNFGHLVLSASADSLGRRICLRFGIC